MLKIPSNQARASKLTRVGLVCLAAGASIPNQARAQVDFTPSAAFVQAGSVASTHEFTTGLAWNWDRQWTLGPGRVGGYWAASLSAWSYPSADDRRTAWLGQLGLIPVFRYRPADGASPWFAAAGLGVTFTTTLYETERKRFSTSFNFGDHIALGRNFGAMGLHEIALRVEHYSNGGIKRPNPGESFVQIRYSRQLR